MRLTTLVVVLLFGCGEGGDAGPAACVDEPGLAPCCDQTPLTAEDCPEGWAFIENDTADGRTMVCESPDGLAPSPHVVTDPAGRVSVRGGATGVTYCDIGSGRIRSGIAWPATDMSAMCAAPCYGPDGRPVPRAECAYLDPVNPRACD